MSAELAKIAQRKTVENQMVLVISGGKRRWIRLAEWKRISEQG